MAKLVLVLLAVVALMLLGKARRRGPRGPSGAAPRPAAAPPPLQPMIACQRCGLHLPRSEAFIDDRGRLFCSAEHRRLGGP